MALGRTLARSYLLYVFALLCVALVGLNVWGAADTFTAVEARHDARRGILTDNVVGVLMVLLTALAMLAFRKVRVERVSLLFFTCQELVNFVCDNSLRAAHLKRYVTSESVAVEPIDDVPYRLRDGEVTAVDAYTVALRTIVGATSRCVYRPRLRPSDRVTLVLSYGDAPPAVELAARVVGDDAVYLNSSDGDPVEFELGVALDAASRAALDDVAAGAATATVRIDKSPRALSVALRSLGYFRSLVGMRAAVVSVLSVYLLSVTDDALLAFVRPYAPLYPKTERFLPLLSLWMSSVFASLPINALRFGWAYKQVGAPSEISTSLVSLVFLLLTAVFLKLHAEGDEATFPLRSKTIVSMLGMALVVLLSSVPEGQRDCPVFVEDVADSLPSAQKATFNLAAALTLCLYGYLLFVPTRSLLAPRAA